MTVSEKDLGPFFVSNLADIAAIALQARTWRIAVEFDFDAVIKIAAERQPLVSLGTNSGTGHGSPASSSFPDVPH